MQTHRHVYTMHMPGMLSMKNTRPLLFMAAITSLVGIGVICITVLICHQQNMKVGTSKTWSLPQQWVGMDESVFAEDDYIIKIDKLTFTNNKYPGITQ